MDDKVKFVAVGVFVVALGAALIAAVLWLAGGGAMHRGFDLYQAISDESVAGLTVNAPVKYRGVDVGKVTTIRLVPNNPLEVQLLFSINRGTPIKTDTIATLATQGLTGIDYIELSGGSQAAPPLMAARDGELPMIPTKPSLSARLEQVLTRVLGSVDKTSRTLNGVFTDENKKSLTIALANIAAVTQTLADDRKSIDAALKNADRTMAHAAEVSARLDGTLARIDKAAGAFDRMSQQIDTTAIGANQAIAAVGADVHRFSDETVPQLEDLMNELKMLSSSLQRLSEQTDRNPKSLIFGKTPVPKGPGE